MLYDTGLDCDEVPPTDPLVTVTADELLPIILRALASLLRRRSIERKMKEKRREEWSREEKKIERNRRDDDERIREEKYRGANTEICRNRKNAVGNDCFL